ncbi:MAG: hypothetical protein IJZ65_07430 [Ruminiclostridium sp.]|nr:hypothetical protein [Ruminiclostridium sp.]
MNKPVKIFVSILLVISIILNPFSSFSASALDPFTIAFLKEVGTWVVTGIISWIGGSLIGSAASDLDQTYYSYLMSHYEEIQAPTLQGGCPVSFQCRYADTELEFKREQGYYTDSEWPVMAYLDESVTLTAEQREFYEYFCTVFNSADIIATSGYLTGYVPSLSVEDYNKIKNQVSNFFLQQAVNDLDEAVELPTYSFDFVGPLPSLTVPVGTDRVSLQKEGFLYTIPFSAYNEWYNGIDTYYYYYPSEELADSAGCNLIFLSAERDGKQWWNGSYQVDCYGGGTYILYNGECYYNCTKAYSAVSNSHTFPLSGFHKGAFVAFLSCDGVRLSDVYTGGSFSMGAVVNLTGQVEAGVPSEAVNDDEFTASTGGSVTVPLTDSEATVGDALLAGLINDNSRVTLDENGNITSVDGITLAKIEELIDLISTGNLAFEDVQQYLDLITTLISNGNWTASEQLIILGNLQSLIDSQSLSISEINTAVQSISESLTATGELILDSDLDIETPGISFIDKFPFCLPFDFYNILCLLCSQPKEPILELPLKANFKNDYINYEIDEVIVLDLTIFRLNGVDMVRVFCNTCSILLFVICLISGTKKFIWK